jgi:hypothetical protein
LNDGKLLVGYFALNFIGPFLWQTVLNVQIMIGVRKAAKFRKMSSGYQSVPVPVPHPVPDGNKLAPKLQKRRKSNDESSTTTMLIAYSIAFLIMQFPAALLNVLEFLCPWIFDDVIGDQGTLGMEQGSNLLIILNSCTNFYIFMMFGSRFRQMVRKMFDTCKMRNINQNWDSMMTSYGLTEISISPNVINSRRCTLVGMNGHVPGHFSGHVPGHVTGHSPGHVPETSKTDKNFRNGNVLKTNLNHVTAGQLVNRLKRIRNVTKFNSASALVNLLPEKIEHHHAKRRNDYR